MKKLIMPAILFFSLSCNATEAPKYASDLPAKTIPVGADSVTINDSQDLNTSNSRPKSKKVLLQSLPISAAVQTALNGKSATTHDHSGVYLESGTTIPTTLSELSDDSTHRVVTDVEKSGWSAKLSSSNPEFSGTMTSTNADGTHKINVSNTGAYTGEDAAQSDMFFNNTTKCLMVYDNSAWVELVCVSQ